MAHLHAARLAKQQKSLERIVKKTVSTQNLQRYQQTKQTNSISSINIQQTPNPITSPRVRKSTQKFDDILTEIKRNFVKQIDGWDSLTTPQQLHILVPIYILLLCG